MIYSALCLGFFLFIVSVYMLCVFFFCLKPREIFSFKVIIVILFGVVIFVCLVLHWQIQSFSFNFPRKRKLKSRRRVKKLFSNGIAENNFEECKSENQENSDITNYSLARSDMRNENPSLDSNNNVLEDPTKLKLT